MAKKYGIYNYDYLNNKRTDLIFSFNTFSQKDLEENKITKEKLSKEVGLENETFDYALPQVWLNHFVDDYCPEGTLRQDYYDLVRSTTFSLYINLELYIISGCIEVEDDIIKSLGNLSRVISID